MGKWVVERNKMVLTLETQDQEPKAESSLVFSETPRDYKEYEEVFSKATQNKIADSTTEGFSKFFSNNTGLDELVFEVPCNPRALAALRSAGMDFLLSKKIIDENNNRQFYALKSLVGEIINDTSHSSDQGEKPPFVVWLKNLNNPQVFSFEVINSDQNTFDQWDIEQDPEKIPAGYGKRKGGTHAGTIMKEDSLELLNARGEYIPINGPDGKKAYTAFVFTKNV